MAIIKITKQPNDYLNIFPNQFKTEKEKQSHSWIKSTMDYFANVAYSQYSRNKQTFAKNYDLVNGYLTRKDYYEVPEVRSFVETLTKDIELPAYVKNYSIITAPLNELVGELTKRPDGVRVKAFDDESKSEELRYKTSVLTSFVFTKAKMQIMMETGGEVSEEEINNLVLDRIKDELDDYTSVAEKWGNHIVEFSKMEFNIKEKEEEAFRDLCISSREYYHVYEDNSKLGFNVKTENPKNVWFLTTPNNKFISDPSGRYSGAYAAGTIHLMEISEIIETFPELTKEEIDHLIDSAQEQMGLLSSRTTIGSSKTGIESIEYDTYDPLVEQERLFAESELSENNDEDDLRSFLGLHGSVTSFGYKYAVIRAYWISKRKIGKLVYEDEVGNIQSMLVDENYKEGTHPKEISIEWGWINQWYQGYKIGTEIYHVKPLKILPYCPIIGTIYNSKNSKPTSIVDLMKPFQILYNICINQLYEILRKEIGNVASVSIRRIPRVKDGDGQDDIDLWEMEARERGIMFDDDSPQNTKAPVSNQTVARNIDLSRSAEIQSRYNLAVALKNECYSLVGMSKERLGSIAPSQTATATNAAIAQSYSQTEPLFVQHEYNKLMLYQAILDAAMYIESNKEVSTISYVNSEGTSAFIQVNGEELKLRDLKVYPTNRPEDKRLFDEIRNLAQPFLQNGGSLYDVVEVLSTNSIRKIKKVFKTFKENQERMQREAMEQQQIMQQQQIESENQRLAAELEAEERRMINENYQKELDRINKKEIAIINALRYGKVQAEDVDTNNVYDVMELDRINMERQRLDREYQLKLKDLEQKRMEFDRKMKLEEEKLKLQRENMKNDIQVAKINAKNKN